MIRSSAALAVLLSAAIPAHATTAAVIDASVCNNQAISMYFAWFMTQQASSSVTSFFFDGQSFQPMDGSASAVQFKDTTDLFIDSHGSPGTLNRVSGEAYATALQAAHPNSPSSVLFAACYSAQPPKPGVLSVLGEVAAHYQNPDGQGTAVGLLTGATDRCSLIGPAASYPQATPIQGVDMSDVRTGAIKTLVDQWKSTPYPGTSVSFEQQCLTLVMNQNYKQMKGFIGKVFDEWRWPYLVLININRGGSALYTCGKNEGVACQ